jgi:prolyl-tRNA synthetase
MYGGANKLNQDALNINIDRDFILNLEGDIAMAQDGFKTEDGSSILREKRGIEVGNIFQLGYHYSSLMKNATFVDKDGLKKPYYMGCYGIGLGRTLATIVEQYHDDKGMTWPKQLAPFSAQLICLKGGEDMAEKVYSRLQEEKIEVLFDDRDISAGAKFGDADLIGNPVRLVVSGKTGEQVEWKERTGEQATVLSLEEVIKRLRD